MNAVRRAALALAFAAASGAFAETRVTGTATVPARPYCGDPVEAVIGFEVSGVSVSEEARRGGFPGGGGYVEIRDAAVRRAGKGWELVVHYVAWKPGALDIPAMSLGGVSFPAIKVETARALGSGGDAVPEPLPQMEAPGFRVALWIAAGSLLALAGAALLFFGKVRPWLARVMETWNARRIRKDFERLLAFLSRTELCERDAFSLLSAGLRRYADARFSLGIGPRTATEAALLPESAFRGGTKALVVSILSRSERVRFAGLPDGGMDDALRAAKDAVERMETGPVPGSEGTAG